MKMLRLLLLLSRIRNREAIRPRMREENEYKHGIKKLYCLPVDNLSRSD